MADLPADRVLQKVTAFITRQHPNKEKELLVFQHPTAGVQLPAGTVERGESVEEAAYREVAEETGLTDVQLVQHIGATNTELTDGWHLFLESATLRAGPHSEAPSLHWVFGRGSWCNVRNEEDGFAEIQYEELNQNLTPAKADIRFSGWVPADVLCNRLARHFYHFELVGDTEERWVQQAERDFECYWTPLTPKPSLVQGQNEWLDFAYDRLL